MNVIYNIGILKVVELLKEDWYPYLHQMKLSKEVTSVSEDNLV